MSRLLVCLLVLLLWTPALGATEEPPRSLKLDWPTGEGKSYVIPVLEIGGFLFGLNQFNRHVIDEREYGSDGRSIWNNLTGPLVVDKDPFKVNQLGHPYQGNIYFGFARSTGVDFWWALLYSFGGSFLWETAGETTPPSLNDHINTSIGGAFIGEAGFRLASLLLEGAGGGKPGFWRELGAAVLSPSTGFNRLAFGDRFDAVFPSRDPETFIRLRLGATFTADVDNADFSRDVTRLEGSVNVSVDYGLPGKPGYRYTRPFDYFHFEFTGVPNARTVLDGVENVSIRGLLAGRTWGLGPAVRGLWGLFGNFDYLSPQIFRVSTTAASVGTVWQWWMGPRTALQGTVLGGLGLGAAGTAGPRHERDYHYGLSPQGLLDLRLIFGDRALLEVTGRQYYVAGTSSEEHTGIDTHDFTQDIVVRGSVGVTLRLFGPHAVGLQYLFSTRSFGSPDLRDRQQLLQTISVFYTFLAHPGLGAVEWRPGR